MNRRKEQKSFWDKELKPHYEARHADSFLSTKSSKKLLVYLNEITCSQEFKNRIGRMRAKYGIPLEGFELIQKTSVPPKQWRYYDDADKNFQNQKDIKELCENYSLLPDDFASIMEMFLFFNKIFVPVKPNAYNLCMVYDAFAGKTIDGTGLSKGMDKYFPIALRISPYASKRDIINYIEKNFREVSEIQQTYKNELIKIGHVRTKRQGKRKIHEFIWTNQSVPMKELKDLVHEKFKEVLMGHELKAIIKKENKRRKKVYYT